MSDREMLEFAAKAAGICLEDGHHWVGGFWTRWNPLADDGDAMRLAVKLGLHARQFPVLDDGMDEPLRMVEVWRVDDDDPLHVEYVKAGDDRLVAIRRAIVRAAAEIGRSMT